MSRTKEDLKVKSSYIKSVEEQSRVHSKRVSEVEKDILAVKQECVQAIQAKEAMLALTLTQAEAKHSAALHDSEA